MLDYSYSQIKNSNNPLTEVDSDVQLSDAFFERSKDLIKDAKNVHVKGQFFYDEPFVTGNFTVEADVVAPSTRSLEPVEFHQKFNFNENYSEVRPTQEQLDEEPDTIITIENDKIDLQTAVEDNLLLSLPSVILTKQEAEDDLYPEGSGWKVISEAEHEAESKDKVNPAFAKLKVLFNDNNKKDHK